MPIVTTEEIRRRLSSPQWTTEQTQAVAAVSAQRESELAAWLQVPITPQERTETVPILPSGLVATTAPIYRLRSVNGVAPVGDEAPEGYEWRPGSGGPRCWLAHTDTAALTAPPVGYSARTYSLLHGAAPRATMHYDAGWGGVPALTGAIAERVMAYAINLHADTVMTTALDAEEPPRQREHWIEDDFVALRAFRRRAA